MPSSSATFSTPPAVKLAQAGGPALVRSVADPAQDTARKLRRAKERLYILFQATGWGVFLVSQIVLSRVFTVEKVGEVAPARDALYEAATMVMIAASGLLLTHYVRLLMTRWGWKELGWLPLVPRVLTTAFVLSVIWSGFGYGYLYFVLGYEWPSRFSMAVMFPVSVLNGAAMFVGWLCIYFFYHVFERLNRMQFEQLRLAANVKEAELRALKSQVNPHFLFNSLNSLRALIEEDAPRARESVTRLSNILRYSLQSGQLETVPFEEEVRIVEDYLALEAIRHEERLQVRWAIAANALRAHVPPMLLQTLVENAIKYGISARRNGGEVTISAAMKGDALVLSVTNPGDLAGPASAAAALAGSSTGVGLRNASERLQLLFGNEGKLELRAEPAGCVTAEVLIPNQSLSS